MKYYFLYFLLFVFFLPTSFAKVNVEEVKSALILCNNDVILKQHDETANTSYIEGNGGVIALYLQKFSSRNGSNTFDLNYYTTVSGIKKVSVSKDSSIKNSSLYGFYSINVLCKKNQCVSELFLYGSGKFIRDYTQDSYIAVCDSENKARRVADMLSKALHL